MTCREVRRDIIERGTEMLSVVDSTGRADTDFRGNLFRIYI